MGLTDFIFGKKKKDEFQDDMEDEPIWQPEYMYYDNFGVLRVGREARDREEELNTVMKLEDKEEKEGKVWYIIESSWIRQWLRYTKTKRNTPCPGPIQNEHLLQFSVKSSENMEENKWIAREKLQQANSVEGRDGEGHYRRINEAVWEKFVELYPGSGPVVTVSEAPYHNQNLWTIDTESIKNIDRLRKVEEDAVKKFKSEHKSKHKSIRESLHGDSPKDNHEDKPLNNEDETKNKEDNEHLEIEIEDIYAGQESEI